MIEFNDQDSSVFDEVMAVLKHHSAFEQLRFNEEDVLSLPGLEIYPDRRKIYRNRREINLTAKEYDLLCLLVANKGRVLTYEQIYQRIKKDKWVNRSISCPEYVQSIYKMMNWNKECRYKIYGRLANSERGLVLVFDLASAVMFSRMAGYQVFRTGIKATAIFLLGEKQTVSNGIEQDGSMAWMQHRPQMRIRPLFADIGILRMAIANTNTRGPSLEKMRTSLPIMVPELLP